MKSTVENREAEGHGLSEFVVTTFAAHPDSPSGSATNSQASAPPQVLKSEIWHCESPMGLGHPLRWVLEKTREGVRIRNLGASTDRVVLHVFQHIDLAELYRETPIDLSQHDRRAERGPRTWVTIRPVLDLKSIAEEAGAVTWRPVAIPAELMAEMTGDRTFRKAALFVGVLAMAMAIFSILVPVAKPNPLELIPPQFTKVLLSPALKTQSTARKAASGGAPTAYNVVQAFQSTAVQQTTKSLLSAGLAKSLLSKSTLLDQASAKSAIAKVFDGKSSLKAMGKMAPIGLDKRISKVGLIGGGDGKGRAAAGYGSSTGTALTGQGSALVGIAEEGPGVSEGLTKDEVGKVVREHLSEVRYCYESAMVRQVGFEGKLVVSFTVRGSGAVKTASAKESSGDARMDNCILSRLLKWKFPKPRGGVDVGVSYPFIFKSLGN